MPAKKKVRKKKVSKKKTKKGIKVEITILRPAPEKHQFVLMDGSKLRDLRDLAFALGTMADDVFWHHANDARNDFANWINDVIKDKELANRIKGIKDRVGTQISILSHLVKKI